MRILIFSAICLLTFACTNDDNCTADTIRTQIIDNKTIMTSYDSSTQKIILSVDDGDNLLFEYDFTATQCDDILDDEWGERLIFEIPIGTTDFEYIDADLASINCYHLEYGAWVSSSPDAVTQGSIKGIKLSDNEWEITTNIKITRELTQTEVIIVGKDFKKVAQQISKHYFPNKILLACQESSKLNLFQNRVAMEGRTTIYVCKNKVCNLPTYDIEEAILQMSV